jgi:serine/threonine protein kinase
MGCRCCKDEEEDVRQPLCISSTATSLSPSSFKVLKIIGRGNFGKVCLVEKAGTKDLFAMKVLKKQLIEEKGQRLHTINERKIMESACSPFIVKLFYAFQTPKALYMVMEYLSGGELFFHLSQQRVFSEPRAKFYVSEILLGLEYLHKNGIIYRDLKPENVLLDSEGHVRLTDFGLSKCGVDDENPKAYTFCGTAEYLAPEILKSQGYNKSVDFWSLGALLYYMLSGAPPHYSKNKSEIFKNVLSKPIEPLFNVSAGCGDLLMRLLKVNVRNT